MKDKDTREKRKISAGGAIILFLIVCAAIAVQKAVFGGDMGSMFFMLWVVLIPIGMLYGYSSQEMEDAAIKFTQKALPAVFVLLAAGALIGCWMAAGTTPAIIYYGIKIVNPRLFLVSAMLLCSVVSLFCGTSSGTVGTAGVAMMGIGNSLGIPAPITAGAVICGAFFGDKMSPMSDTTILASSVSEVNIFKHIRHMIYDQVPAYLLSVIFFLFIGFRYGGSVDSQETTVLMDGLKDTFRLGPATMIPLIITGLMLAFRQSALLSILGGAVSAIFVAIFYQGMPVADAFNVFYSGFHVDTNISSLATLINRGGVADMWSLAGITLFGFTVAGMLDYLGVMQKLANVAMKWIHSPVGITFMTILFGFAGNAIAFSQNFAIVMTGTLMAPMYPKFNMQPKNCSRDLEAGGTYGCMFIPWNANTVFASATLGVSAFEFMPFIPLLYLSPIIVIIFAALRFHLDKIYDDVGYVDVTERLSKDPEKQKEIS